MAVLTRDQIIDLMIREVRDKMPDDEAVEVYNEMFRNAKVNFDDGLRDHQSLRNKMATYLAGLEQDMVVHECRLVLPDFLSMWYNEEDDVYEYTPIEEYQCEMRDE